MLRIRVDSLNKLHTCGFGSSVTVSNGSWVAVHVCSFIYCVVAIPYIYLAPLVYTKVTTLNAIPAPVGQFSALSSVTISEGQQFRAVGQGSWPIYVDGADGNSGNRIATAEKYCFYKIND